MLSLPLSLGSNDISQRPGIGQSARTGGIGHRKLPNGGSPRRPGSQVCDHLAKEAHRVGSFRGAETHTRSVLKAVSWRTLGTIDTFAISWFMTGRLGIAGSIAALEVITKIAWYYLHERVWAAIAWGRR